MVDPEGDVIAREVMALFPDGFKGVCIDIGAYHPTWLSNTYSMEVAGWDVYCVEPNPYCMAELQEERENVIEYAIGSENEDGAPFYVYRCGHGPNGMAGYTGLIEKTESDFALYGSGICSNLIETVHVNVRTLDWVLNNVIKARNIDFVSIDVEGSELDVLRGFDLLLWKPKVIVIENISTQDAAQASYLLEFGYQPHMRFVYNDIYIRRNL